MTPDIIKITAFYHNVVNPLIWAFSIYFFLSGCILFKYTDFPRKHFYIYRYKLNMLKKEVLVLCSGTLNEFMQGIVVGSSNKLEQWLYTKNLSVVLLLQPSKKSYILSQNGAVYCHYCAYYQALLISKSSQGLLELRRISSKTWTF